MIAFQSMNRTDLAALLLPKWRVSFLPNGFTIACFYVENPNIERTSPLAVINGRAFCPLMSEF